MAGGANGCRAVLMVHAGAGLDAGALGGKAFARHAGTTPLCRHPRCSRGETNRRYPPPTCLAPAPNSKQQGSSCTLRPPAGWACTGQDPANFLLGEPLSQNSAYAGWFAWHEILGQLAYRISRWPFSDPENRACACRERRARLGEIGCRTARRLRPGCNRTPSSRPVTRSTSA